MAFITLCMLRRSTCRQMGVSEGSVNGECNGEQTHHWNGGSFLNTPTGLSSIPWWVPTLTWFLNRYHRDFRALIAELVGQATTSSGCGHTG